MANLYTEVLVVCPYFVADTGRTITCEGDFQGAVCKHWFESAILKDAHSKACCQRFDSESRCPHAAWLRLCYEDSKHGEKNIFSAMQRIAKAREGT